jgi:hypothetical protein
VLDQRAHYRRHEQAGRRPPRSHVVEPGLGIEARLQTNHATGGQRRQHLDAQATNVKQRQRGQGARACIEALRVDRGIDIRHQGRLRVQRALGFTRRAAGVNEQEVVVLRVAAIRLALETVERVETRIGMPGCEPRVGRDLSQFRRRQPPVQRHEAQTQLRAGQQGGEHGHAVQAEPAECCTARQADGA